MCYLDLAALVATEPAASPARALLESAGLEADVGVDADEVHETGDDGVDLLGAGVLGARGGEDHGGGDEEGGDEGLEEMHFGGEGVEALSLGF